MRTGFDYEVTRPIEESEAPLRIHQSLNGKCFLVLQQHDQQPFPIAAHAVTAGHEDDPAFSIIDHLGSGVLRGYLRKGSSKDPNVWRRHWFVLKEDKIWYCKSKEHQFNCSHIPLVGNTCDEAPRDVCAPYCFEIHTSQRVYQLCASNRQDMHTWIKAIQRQIELSSDNDYIHAAELLICDEERAGSRRDAQTLAKAEASLEGLLCHARGFELLRRFIAGGEQLEESLNFLRDVRLYRERCENIKGSPEEHRTLVWAIAKSIVQQHLQGQIELNSFERAAVCGRADAAVSNPAEAQPPTELFATLQSEVLEQNEHLRIRAQRAEREGGTAPPATRLSSATRSNPKDSKNSKRKRLAAKHKAAKRQRTLQGGLDNHDGRRAKQRQQGPEQDSSDESSSLDSASAAATAAAARAVAAFFSALVAFFAFFSAPLSATIQIFVTAARTFLCDLSFGSPFLPP